jgi:ADP-ribosyl-[dinitrogen reductase] hydrolase
LNIRSGLLLQLRNNQTEGINMLGAVVGDILGSTYERKSTASREETFFPVNSAVTDDSVCTVAVADARLRQQPYEASLHQWGNQYPRCGFGSAFIQWLATDEKKPYGSYGNGALMRVSPTVALTHSLDEALEQAIAATVVTHNHEISVGAVQTYVKALWLALQSGDHAKVCAFLESEGVVAHDVDEAHAKGEFHIRADETLADVLSCLKKARDFESLMREGLYHGGDTDTICAIAGTFGEALWGIPDTLVAQAWELIPVPMQTVLLDEYELIGQYHPDLWKSDPEQSS